MVDHLTKEESAFIVQEVENYETELNEIFKILNMRDDTSKPPTVLELCCEEDSGITKAVEAAGGRGIRCGLHNGCDLNKRSGMSKVLSLVKTEKPDLVWVALPCGPTSAIQELNKLTPEGYAKIQAKVARSRKLASRAVSVMEFQASEGREVAQEWPKNNKAWEFKSIKEFWRKRDCYEAFVDGCAYGLQAPTGGSIKKPWRLRCTTQRIWKMQMCSCQEPHVPCEGGDLTRMTALYPKKMCQQVAKMVMEIHSDLEEKAFGVQPATLEEDCDMECLKPCALHRPGSAEDGRRGAEVAQEARTSKSTNLSEDASRSRSRKVDQDPGFCGSLLRLSRVSDASHETRRHFGAGYGTLGRDPDRQHGVHCGELHLCFPVDH